MSHLILGKFALDNLYYLTRSFQKILDGCAIPYVGHGFFFRHSHRWLSGLHRKTTPNDLRSAMSGKIMEE